MAKLVAALVFLVLVLPVVAYGFPMLVGQDRAYIVLSGSMEPMLSPGDVVFASRADPQDLRVGDVITYRATADSDTLYTHRIVEIVHQEALSRDVYRTKGDANEDPDPNLVLAEQIVSKYAFHVPFYGYVISFAMTRAGLVAFVFIPGTLVILHQLTVIAKTLIEMEKKKKTNKEAEDPPERADPLQDAPRAATRLLMQGRRPHAR